MLKSTATDGIQKLTRLKLILIASSLSICSHGWTSPQVAEAPTVQSCQYLKDVEGSSGYGKNLNWTDLAKHSVLKKAEALGASHVVWERSYPVGAFNGIVVGKAYQCAS